MRKTILAMAAAITAAATPAAAEPSWRVLTQFDDAPEGLASDGQGGLFASLYHSGRVVRVGADGKVTEIATLRSVVGDAKGSTLGIEWDGADTLYVAFAEYSERYSWPANIGLVREACGDSTVKHTGLYKVAISTGKVEAVATRADGYPFCFTDEPTIGPDGSVYLSDLSFSGIWRYSPKTGEVTMWSKDPLFDAGPHPMSGFPVGVNGIAVSPAGDAVYGVTGGNPMVVRIPINADGSAGQGVKVAFGYDNMDGIAFDKAGNIYVTEAIRHEIWKLSPDAAKRQQIGNPLDAPLGSPANIAFVGDEICATNLNFFGNLPPEKANTIVCVSGTLAKW